MMKAFSILVATLVLCLADCRAEGDLVGRFQPEGAVVRASKPLAGRVTVTVESARFVDIRGHAATDLQLEFDIRVVRDDGAVGPKSLEFVRNGRVFLIDTDGKRVFEGNSPVHNGVAEFDRRAGEWMHASYRLDNMAAGSGILADAVVFDYNDIPKEAEQTGVTMEVRNVRVVDMRRERAREAELIGKTRAEENPVPRTMCNPMDLDYCVERGKRQDDGTMKDFEIFSADTLIVVFKSEYWLFASRSEGYWFSKDLAKWELVRIGTEHPLFDQFDKWAPATCVVGDTLYVCHSQSGNMLKTKNPHDPNAWQDIGRSDGWQDPAMFYDDPADGGDGFVYLYRGLSHRNPVDVIKLDPRENMKKVGEPIQCCWPDALNRGYEVAGDNNTRYDDNDTMEGPWCVKRNGKYYITCATPGTGFASYCDNCFMGDSPTGPFVLCPSSPSSRKSTGFTQAAGHGALFQDLDGRWWKIDSCRIRGINRRLVLFPAMFDEKGWHYTNSMLSDVPMYVPARSKNPFHETGPGWMVLSEGKRATASSNPHMARFAFDEELSDAWIAATEKPGEWISVDLGKVYAVWSVQVNFGDIGYKRGGRDIDGAYRYLLEFSQDGKTWRTLVDRTRQTVNRQHEYVEFKDKVGARYVRLTNKGPIPGDGKLAVTSLRIFGEGGGTPPAAVDMDGVFAQRRADDNRSAGIEWPAAKGADGYFIRYGISPDMMNQHYQVKGAQSIRINSLHRWQDYWFTIDSYNENGLTRGTKAIHLPSTQDPIEGYDPGGNNTAISNRVAGVAVHEAEKAKFGGKGVRVEYEVRASGARALLGFGGKDSFVEFKAVQAKNSKGVLRLGYSAIAETRVAVSVNGGTPKTAILPKTRGWPTYETHDVELGGLAAENMIRIEGLEQPIHLDSIQLVPQTSVK